MFEGSRGVKPSGPAERKSTRRVSDVSTGVGSRRICRVVIPVEVSLRDTFLCLAFIPWVETHGYLQESLRDANPANVPHSSLRVQTRAQVAPEGDDEKGLQPDPDQQAITGDRFEF